MSRTARQTVKAYRAQAARFADPARVTVGRAGAAFLAAKGAPQDRRTVTGPRIGDTITARAMNGHSFEYRVIGFDPDGRPQTSQHDAYHSEACTCWKSEDADYLPEW